MVAAFGFGLVFIIALLIIAWKLPDPTTFQYNVIRTILPLAAAGIAAMIPGFINVEISSATNLLIRAGGALAVFVLVYFFNPAQLADPRHSSTGQTEIMLPPPPPYLSNGQPFSDEQRIVFISVWRTLINLDRAGEALWQSVSDRTLSDFAERWHEAKECVEEHALFFSKDDYHKLKDALWAANFYLKGKDKLSLIYLRQVFSDSTGRLAAAGEKDRYVTPEVRHRIQQNKRWLSRYRNILEEIRSSLHEANSH